MLDCVRNGVVPDQMPRSAASDLGLYYLLRPVCPNTYCPFDITWKDVFAWRFS